MKHTPLGNLTGNILYYQMKLGKDGKQDVHQR